MDSEKITLSEKTAEGYVSSLGSFNLVWVKTDVGMVGCGAFDVMALDNFHYPAAKVKSKTGGSISSVKDVLEGVVKEINGNAKKLGIREGITGREALEKM